MIVDGSFDDSGTPDSSPSIPQGRDVPQMPDNSAARTDGAALPPYPPGIRTPVSALSPFTTPQQPASASPSISGSADRPPLRRRETMPDLRSGLRSARDSTPVPDLIVEDGEITDQMSVHFRPFYHREPAEVSPTTTISPNSGSLPSAEPVDSFELRCRSSSRGSRTSLRPPTPDLVHSPEPEEVESCERVIYEPVPPNEPIPVKDVSQQHTKQERYGGEPQGMVMGSIRGRYLEDFNEDLRLQVQDIIDDEYRKPPEIRMPENLLKTHDTSKSWDRKIAARRKAESNTFTWINETWGPPIENPLKLSPKSSPGPGRHPSSTLQLNDQYRKGSASAKRPSIDGSIVSSPGKKPRLKLTVRPPEKEHTQFTAPQMERETPAHPLLSRKTPPPPRPTFCSYCKAHEDSTSIFVCENCGLNAWCSRNCRERFAPLHAMTCAPKKPSASQVADMSHLSIMNDPRNYVVDDDDEIMVTTESETDEAPLRRALEAPLPPRRILAFRVVNFRVLEYHVAGHSGSLWQAAESLHGYLWTVAMAEFWESSQRNRLWRRFSERPTMHDLDPGIIGRFITGTVLENQRSLTFDVRDFDDVLADDWRRAAELGEA